jgi:hypothetical protein
MEGESELGARDLIEHAFACPSCGEPITMLVDPIEADQEYVEDCEVCCNPIGVHAQVRRGALVRFDARPLA